MLNNAQEVAVDAGCQQALMFIPARCVEIYGWGFLQTTLIQLLTAAQLSTPGKGPEKGFLEQRRALNTSHRL